MSMSSYIKQTKLSAVLFNVLAPAILFSYNHSLNKIAMKPFLDGINKSIVQIESKNDLQYQGKIRENIQKVFSLMQDDKKSDITMDYIMSVYNAEYNKIASDPDMKHNSAIKRVIFSSKKEIRANYAESIRLQGSGLNIANILFNQKSSLIKMKVVTINKVSFYAMSGVEHLEALINTSIVLSSEWFERFGELIGGVIKELARDYDKLPYYSLSSYYIFSIVQKKARDIHTVYDIFVKNAFLDLAIDALCAPQFLVQLSFVALAGYLSHSLCSSKMVMLDDDSILNKFHDLLSGTSHTKKDPDADLNNNYVSENMGDDDYSINFSKKMNCIISECRQMFMNSLDTVCEFNQTYSASAFAKGGYNVLNTGLNSILSFKINARNFAEENVFLLFQSIGRNISANDVDHAMSQYKS